MLASPASRGSGRCGTGDGGGEAENERDERLSTRCRTRRKRQRGLKQGPHVFGRRSIAATSTPPTPLGTYTRAVAPSRRRAGRAPSRRRTRAGEAQREGGVCHPRPRRLGVSPPMTRCSVVEDPRLFYSGFPFAWRHSYMLVRRCGYRARTSSCPPDPKPCAPSRRRSARRIPWARRRGTARRRAGSAARPSSTARDSGRRRRPPRRAPRSCGRA